MNLEELAALPPPVPWEGDSKIPWHEAEFSRRMLDEHLDQSHDMASRRLSLIERQVDFLFEKSLGGQPGRVLDLGCGPGLYTAAFAGRGCRCTGVDFSPASIEYARGKDPESNYVLGDIREVEPGSGFDLAVLMYGEFNTFSRTDGVALLEMMRDAVFPGGSIALELQAEQVLRLRASGAPAWHVRSSSVFSGDPHLWLEDHHWFEDEAVGVNRFFVVDDNGAIEMYTDTAQAYFPHECVELLQETGFRRISRAPNQIGDPGTYLLIAGT